MNLLFWKKNPEIDTFATDAANKLFSSAQPDLIFEYFSTSDHKKKNRKNHSKVDRALANLLNSTNQFKTLHLLGLYGKARFHLKFQLRLKELGYDSAVIDKINETLMINTP